MTQAAARICKVLIAGPVGVGKTTAVQTVSDVPVLTTEASPTDETRWQKPTTTVAMDFGVLQLTRSQSVHVYGTPGQKRFDFMWDILSGGSAGVLLLVDGSQEGFSDLELYLQSFSKMAATRRLVVGVTRREPNDPDGLSGFHDYLTNRNLLLPIFDADPRSRHDIVVLIKALLAASNWNGTDE